MDGRTKLLFASFILAVLILGFFCSQKYLVQRDYLIYAEALCNPLVEVCFVYTCNPEETDDCSGDPEEDTSYYKEVRRMANRFPECDPNSGDCIIDRCDEDEVKCNITLCDPEDPEQVCSAVGDFTIEAFTEEDVQVEESDEHNEEPKLEVAS